jgi:hypothetical protein
MGGLRAPVSGKAEVPVGMFELDRIPVSGRIALLPTAPTKPRHRDGSGRIL